MTIFLVECSGGEYEDCWNVVEKCFSSKELADEYIEKRKKLIKQIQNDEEKFNKLFNAFCDEIDTDGKPYFNIYGATFEDFINKLETYKERNTVICDFLNTFNRQYIEHLHKFYMDECMLGNSMKNCRINFYIVPMHVSDKVEL
jgi:hypothetical protein